MNTMPHVRVLIMRDGDTYVAQCIDYDIGTQAPDYPTLRRRISAVVQAEFDESMRRFKKPFAGIDPAPAEYREKWERQQERLVPTQPTAEKKESFEFEFSMCA